MTGAIISQLYWNDQFNHYSRYFINGSFFFIEPDLAVTTFSNLCDLRNRHGMVYAEDYFYFDSPIKLFESDAKGSAKQCIRLDREWLTEFPDKNITLIKFPFPVSSECFAYNEKSLVKDREYVICEGYGESDYITIQEDPDSIDFILVDESQQRKIKFFRQMAKVESVDNAAIYTDELSIENLDVLFTDMQVNLTMIGGPILDYKGKTALGILSHEPDDPFVAEKFMGVKLEW